MISKEKVILPGTNAKMNEFQAAMGLCNLENVDIHIQQRREIYFHYKKNLHPSIKYPEITASRYNYAYMPIVLENNETRESVYKTLEDHKIYSRKYFYPLATEYEYIKKDPFYSKYELKLEKAKEISQRILCLPLYPTLEMKNVNKIIDIVW